MNRSLGKLFTLLLIFSAFLGSRLIQIGFGDYNITPYRLACAVGLVLIPLNKTTINTNRFVYSYLLFLICWILYSFFLFIISTPDKTGYWEALFFLLCGTVSTYYIGTYIKDFRMLKRCFLSIELASVIPFVFAIYEVFVGKYMFVSDTNADAYSMDSAEWSSLGVRVPISTFSNPNDFSFMILIVLISTFILYRMSIGKRRYLHLLMFFISLFLVIVAQSRAAFISVIICMSIIFRYRFSGLKKTKKRFFITMLLLFLGCCLWLIIFYQDIFTLLLFVMDHSNMIRLNLIKNGFIFLESSYYMGVGLGNIEYYMLHYSIHDTGHILNMHNWWMEMLTSSGIIVFSWYLFLFFRLVMIIIKCIRLEKNLNVKNIYIMSLSFLLMFVLDSMSSSSLARTECSWVIMALMFVIPSFAPQKALVNRTT